MIFASKVVFPDPLQPANPITRIGRYITIRRRKESQRQPHLVMAGLVQACPGHPDNRALCLPPPYPPPQAGGDRGGAGASPAMTPRVLLLLQFTPGRPGPIGGMSPRR